jgi:hypothetical protein
MSGVVSVGVAAGAAAFAATDIVAAGTLTVMGALEATAALGAGLSAVGAITHNKGLQIAGMGLGLVGGVGALATSAGFFGAEAGSTALFGSSDVTAGAAAGSGAGGAFTTAEGATMGNAAGLGTDAAGVAASGPGTVTDIIDSIANPGGVAAVSPNVTPAAAASSPNVTPPAAAETPYTGPQGDGEFGGGGPGEIARRAGNAAGGAPPGSLPMPTAQSPSPMTPDEVLAAGGWPPAWTANTNSLGPPAGALSSPPPTVATPAPPQLSNSAPSSISFPATSAPSVPANPGVPGIQPTGSTGPPTTPQGMINQGAADLAAQQGQGLTAGMTPAKSGGPPSMFDNLLSFASKDGGGRLLAGVVQAGAAFISGATSTLTPAQVAALQAQANANQAAANLSNRQLANMGQPIPAATRTQAPPGLINTRLPPPNTVTGAPT